MNHHDYLDPTLAPASSLYDEAALRDTSGPAELRKLERNAAEGRRRCAIRTVINAAIISVDALMCAETDADERNRLIAVHGYLREAWWLTDEAGTLCAMARETCRALCPQHEAAIAWPEVTP